MKYSYGLVFLVLGTSGCAFKSPPPSVTSDVAPVQEAQVRFSFSDRKRVVEVSRTLSQLDLPITLSATVPDQAVIKVSRSGLDLTKSIRAAGIIKPNDKESISRPLELKRVPTLSDADSATLAFEISGLRNIFSEKLQGLAEFNVELYQDQKEPIKFTITLRTPPHLMEVTAETIEDARKAPKADLIVVLRSKIQEWQGRRFYLLKLARVKNASNQAVRIGTAFQLSAKVWSVVTRYSPVNSSCGYSNQPLVEQRGFSPIVYVAKIDSDMASHFGATQFDLNQGEDALIGVFGEGDPIGFRAVSSLGSAQVVDRCELDCDNKDPYAPSLLAYSAGHGWIVACNSCRSGDLSQCRKCKEHDDDGVIRNDIAIGQDSLFCHGKWFDHPITVSTPIGTQVDTFIEPADDGTSVFAGYTDTPHDSEFVGREFRLFPDDQVKTDDQQSLQVK